MSAQKKEERHYQNSHHYQGMHMDDKENRSNSTQRRRRNGKKRKPNNSNQRTIKTSHQLRKRTKRCTTVRTDYDEDIRRCLQDLDGIIIETLIIEKELTNARKETKQLAERSIPHRHRIRKL